MHTIIIECDQSNVYLQCVIIYIHVEMVVIFVSREYVKAKSYLCLESAVIMVSIIMMISFTIIIMNVSTLVKGTCLQKYIMRRMALGQLPPSQLPPPLRQLPPEQFTLGKIPPKQFPSRTFGYTPGY